MYSPPNPPIEGIGAGNIANVKIIFWNRKDLEYKFMSFHSKSAF